MACDKLARVREKRSWSSNIAFHYCSHVRDDFFLVTYCGELWLSCLHACETRQNHSTKALEVCVTSFVCSGREEGRCILRAPKAGGDKVMLYRNVVKAALVTTALGHSFYMQSGVWQFLAAPLVKGSISAPVEKDTKMGKKKEKKSRIDELQSLCSWNAISEFLMAVGQLLFCSLCLWC